MFMALQGLGHRHGHFLLLRTIFEILRLGENSARRKNLPDLGGQIVAVQMRRALSGRLLIGRPYNPGTRR